MNAFLEVTNINKVFRPDKEVEVAALRRAQISHVLLPGIAKPQTRSITHITEVRRHG